MTPSCQDVTDYMIIFGILFVCGVTISFQLVFYRKHIYESWDIIIASSFFTWLFLENWVLRKEFYKVNPNDPQENKKYDELKYIQLIGELTMQNSVMASTNETLLNELKKCRDMKMTALHWQMMSNKANATVAIQKLSEFTREKPKKKKLLRTLSMQIN